MDADTPRFTLREVAAATGWHLGRMRDNFVRGTFPWAADEGKAKVAGATSRLSLRSAIRLGITHALWAQGMAPREAFKAATSFADFGSAPSRNAYGVARLAGSLFPEGYETILLWRAGVGARIIPIEIGSGVPLDILLAEPFDGAVGPVTLLRVDDLVERVLAALVAV